MGLLEELAELKQIIAECGLQGSISKTVYGYVYNEAFKTERLGEGLEEAKEALRKLGK